MNTRQGTILPEEVLAAISKSALTAGFRMEGDKIYAPSDMPINREIERLIVEMSKVRP